MLAPKFPIRFATSVQLQPCKVKRFELKIEVGARRQCYNTILCSGGSLTNLLDIFHSPRCTIGCEDTFGLHGPRKTSPSLFATMWPRTPERGKISPSGVQKTVWNYRGNRHRAKYSNISLQAIEGGSPISVTFCECSLPIEKDTCHIHMFVKLCRYSFQ